MTEESISPEEEVFYKVINANNSKERSQWIEFYKVIVEVENEEKTEQRKLLKQQKKFSNVMIVSVFIAVVIIVGWVLGKEKPAIKNSPSAPCLSP